ncbi:T9SS type A sorting domain-containing protein [Aequorivita sp. KMM 9714]|uniref:T9SS type A sorting domain-containing protein n=1 Tax=Aequorivita sp. KMM 9714 TaxID=2707173 RepID=UPI0013EA5A01|nr:T9SS type A sorting domain-containing protein [Aequorivita sp. KMM 9714]NGX83045.1 T9SS type A sorting domain-containing protein [Aequorivita sp. KMM 9714]
MKKYILIFILLLSSFVFSQDGELDLSFANNGIYNPTNLNYAGSLLDLSVDSSNNIFISGNVVNSDGTKSIMVIKLLPHGEIDTSFANNGYSYVNFNPTAFVSKNIVLENGKIILVGRIRTNNNDILIVRLDSDGTLDSSFGINGRVTIDSGFGDDRGMAVVEYNNSYIIGGYLSNAQNNTDFALVRIDEYGALMTGFGNNGILQIDRDNGQDIIRDILVDDLGNILACGNTTVENWPPYDNRLFTAFKTDDSGNFDANFGDDGFVNIWLGDSAYSLKKIDDSYFITGINFDPMSDEGKTVIAKIDSSGILENSFALNGVLILEYVDYYYAGFSSLIQDNGKLIVGGPRVDFFNGIFDLSYSRINPNGTLDVSFGNNGIASFNFLNQLDASRSLSKQFDNKFLSLGLDLNNHLFLTRHNIDQSLSINDSGIRNLNYLVYPNPVNDKLFIKRPTREPATGNLYDTTGKLILSFTLNDQENQINLENLADGIYFLEIYDTKNIIVRKVVIE